MDQLVPAVEIIATPGLGDRSYVVHDHQHAVVVDPQRDIDRVCRVLDERGLTLSLVLETHVHNDYLTGGPVLAAEAGATYVLPAGSGARMPHEPVADGQVLTAGRLSLLAVATPGHTLQHTSYAVGVGDEAPTAVFTGGSMLFGGAGRTDLTGPEHARPLAAAQRRSLRRLVELLPAEAAVLPTHGFGSFCAVGPTGGQSSTLGEQARVNPAMLQAEEEYVTAMLDGLGPVPSWYARMAPANRRGPAPADLSMPPLLEQADLARRLAAGEWVVDLRARRDFARAHLRGSLSFELSDAFITYLGWLLPADAEPTLLAPAREQILTARRELSRIGVDRVQAALWEPVAPEDSFPVASFADLEFALGQGGVVVLDVRQRSEHATGTLPGALTIPLHELPDRLGEVERAARAGASADSSTATPESEAQVWVHCASGYRAGAAASLLARAGRRVVLVDDSLDDHRSLCQHQGMTGTTVTSRADVTIDRPERWAKQLTSHLSRRASLETTPDGDVLTLGAGTGTVRVEGEQQLVLLASAPDEESLAVVQRVLGGHLERFAEKHDVHVTWVR